MSGHTTKEEKLNAGSSASTQQKSTVTKRFEQSHAKHIAAAQKVLEQYAPSSDEDEELDEGKILDSLYKHYKPDANNAVALAIVPQKTATFFENALHSGSATCLICIGSIKRAEAIWACKYCYCFFHLNCIQRWAKDSVAQLKAKSQPDEQGYYNNLGEYVAPKRKRALQWSCPQCRKNYTPEERPTEYKCFCGKETNPQSTPFLLPHSCGELCGKLLQPTCGHTCMLLCHPGPCPPCSQYANTRCLCGKSAVKSVRCIDKEWKCNRKCNEYLRCGEHKCKELCHKPKHCPPCTSTSMKACECGSEVKKRNCSELKWHCNKVCGSKYSCGSHTCKRICHDGACGDCPLSLPRSCPCGKTQKIVPCTEAIDPCGDTCQKLLTCGLHTCTQRCHRGECNLCIVITKKKCRCGLHEKELPCWKNFTCETKCKQMRDCGKHACNKKCCDGQCPQCDKVCGKPLSCQKHKCQSICHEGPCYPCNQQSQVNCRCGKTSKRVPCGRERTARVMCMELCRIPSKCHHPNKHRCHKNECPPCNQKCDQPNSTTGCSHICEAKCHAAVKVLKQNSTNGANANVWDVGKKFEFKALPHPPCEQPVTVTCIGGHEVADWPCWNSKPSSCQRPCKRSLRCGNHKCELVCHSVPDVQDMKRDEDNQSSWSTVLGTQSAWQIVHHSEKEVTSSKVGHQERSHPNRNPTPGEVKANRSTSRKKERGGPPNTCLNSPLREASSPVSHCLKSNPNDFNDNNDERDTAERKKRQHRARPPPLPPLGCPGSLDDERRQGLSGCGVKWYLRYLQQGDTPDVARSKALLHKQTNRSYSTHSTDLEGRPTSTISRQGETTPVTLRKSGYLVQYNVQQAAHDLGRRSVHVSGIEHINTPAEMGRGAQSTPNQKGQRIEPLLPTSATHVVPRKQISFRGVRLAILPQNYPAEVLKPDALTLLTDAIMHEVFKGWEHPLSFYGVYFRPGILIVDCKDEKVATWLTNVAPRLESWEGPTLIAMRGKDIPPTHTITMYLPLLTSGDCSLEFALKLLRAQNAGLNTDIWRIINSSIDDEGIRVNVSIDEASLSLIKSAGFKLFYQFSYVTVSLWKQRNRCTVAPVPEVVEVEDDAVANVGAGSSSATFTQHSNASSKTAGILCMQAKPKRKLSERLSLDLHELDLDATSEGDRTASEGDKSI